MIPMTAAADKPLFIWNQSAILLTEPVKICLVSIAKCNSWSSDRFSYSTLNRCKNMNLQTPTETASAVMIPPPANGPATVAVPVNRFHSKRQMIRPGQKEFDRVQKVMAADPALKKFLNGESQHVKDSTGQELKVPLAVSKVVNAIYRDNKYPTEMPQYKILRVAARELLQPAAGSEAEQASGVPNETPNSASPTVQKSDRKPVRVPQNNAPLQTVPTEPAETKPSSVPWSESEQVELEKYETTIQQGWDSLVAASLALREIRDKHLYRRFGTFDEYCRDRWGLARSTAYQRLELAATFQAVSAMADTAQPPHYPNERQARVLSGLSAEEKYKVWAESLRSTKNGPVTYKDVKAARNRLGLATPAANNRTTTATTNASTPPISQTREERWQKIQAILDHEYKRLPESSRCDFISFVRSWISHREQAH